MKTIKQIADEIGVSKTAIRKRLTLEVKNKHTETTNGTIYISPEGEALIKQGYLDTVQTRFPESSRKPFAEVSGNVSGAFAVLQEQLTAKDRQIEAKDIQIAELNSQLRSKDEQIKFLQDNAAAAQALHAGTIRKQLTDGGGDPADPEPQLGIIARLFRKKRSDGKR